LLQEYFRKIKKTLLAKIFFKIFAIPNAVVFLIFYLFRQ